MAQSAAYVTLHDKTVTLPNDQNELSHKFTFDAPDVPATNRASGWLVWAEDGTARTPTILGAC